jgi:hypothetical protein
MRSVTRLAVALGAALLAACTSVPDQRAASAAAAGICVSSVFVVKRGWHIDVGVSVASLPVPLSSVASKFPGSRYILFGFGDRRYLTAKHKNADALLAALRGGPGLMLVTALSVPPQDAFGAAEVAQLALTGAQARALQSFIWQTLSSQLGAPLVVASGPYPASLYLGSGERYSAFHTCNTWAAQSLRAAGLPVHSGGVIFAAQLWWQVRAVPARLSCRVVQSRPGTPQLSSSPAARPQ